MLDVLEHNREQIKALCQEHQVASLAVFGSAVDERFRQERSDVDLLVAFRDGLEPSTYAACYFGLKESLETLLGYPVDLVTRQSLTNPYLAETVAREEQPLYAA